MACRVHDLVGWHVELYIDSKDLGDLKSTLLKLPAVSIDHLGLTATGQKDVLDLAEKGVKIKASGFGRIDVNIEKTLTTIYSVNPEALLFGTDLPGTRAKRPFEINDLEIIQNLFDQKAQHKILSNNAKAFYKIKK
jgi:predicted TIM-barrel fold metal-dependent hydrolase